MGRFLQTDPIGYWAGLNLYTYCDNNPINWVDPFGFDKTKQKSYWDYYWDEFWLSLYYDITGQPPGFAPFEWWDISSRLLPETNYGGWTKSGPGIPTSELDRAFKKHDELLAKTGTSWINLGNRGAREAHKELIKDWVNYIKKKMKKKPNE